MKFKNRICFYLVLKLAVINLTAAGMLIPMDLTQSNHLKAYGIAFLSIASEKNVEWLLNYRGGSFLLEDSPVFKREALQRGVFFEMISEQDVQNIYLTIDQNNMEKILLVKEPKIAVYSPPNKQPWDDAVTLACFGALHCSVSVWVNGDAFLDAFFQL